MIRSITLSARIVVLLTVTSITAMPLMSDTARIARVFALASLLMLCGVGYCRVQGDNTLTAQEGSEGYQLLFNGKDLEGWSGDPSLWRVENGVIVGSTDGHAINANTFLVYDREFQDFHLTADVRLRNGNSGIQFRSQLRDGGGWVVTGYQADFSDAGERSAWGNLYEEQGRGRGLMANPNEGWLAAKQHVNSRGWNRIEVHCEGSRMDIWLNGVKTVSVSDDKARRGVIALQLHTGDPMRAEFRNLKIKPLTAVAVGAGQ